MTKCNAGQTLVEFAMLTLVFVGVLGMAARVLMLQWNRVECSYFSYVTAHRILTGEALAPSSSIHGFKADSFEIQEDDDSVRVTARCDSLTESTILLKLEALDEM